MKIEAYLFFPGNTREAIKFYKTVFGGNVAIKTLGEVNPKTPIEEQDLVANATLSGNNINFRANDRQDTTLEPQKRIHLSVVGSDEKNLRKIFNNLAKGGSVESPLQKTHWGDIFGIVTDKYGITWQIDIELNKKLII